MLIMIRLLVSDKKSPVERRLGKKYKGLFDRHKYLI